MRALIFEWWCVVASLLAAIEAREGQAIERAEQLRKQIDALSVQLQEAEAHQTRLAITRETVRELLDEPQAAVAQITTAATAVPHAVAVSGPMQQTPGYEQIMTVLEQARGPLRCKDILAALQWDSQSRHIEGVRSKLRRLEARGLVTQVGAGLFQPAGAGAQ